MLQVGNKVKVDNIKRFIFKECQMFPEIHYLGKDGIIEDIEEPVFDGEEIPNIKVKFNDYDYGYFYESELVCL